MKRPRINFIGCGRVGKTIARLLHIHHLAHIEGIVCSSLENAITAVKFTGEGTPVANVKQLPRADIYFITTPDDLIQQISDELAKEKIAGSIVVHCSGLLSSDVLKRPRGGHIASVHPIKSFANPTECVSSFSGTYCAVEGDELAMSVLTHLLENMGCVIFHINKEDKYLYHAASVIANNYMVTLHYHATQSYKAAGIPEETAKKISTMLATDALRNITTMTHESALTGPIQRGDAQTIEKHMAALSCFPFVQHMYATLGEATLPLTQHSQNKKDELRKALEFFPNPGSVCS